MIPPSNSILAAGDHHPETSFLPLVPCPSLLSNLARHTACWLATAPCFGQQKIPNIPGNPYPNPQTLNRMQLRSARFQRVWQVDFSAVRGTEADAHTQAHGHLPPRTGSGARGQDSYAGYDPHHPSLDPHLSFQSCIPCLLLLLLPPLLCALPNRQDHRIITEKEKAIFPSRLVLEHFVVEAVEK